MAPARIEPVFRPFLIAALLAATSLTAPARADEATTLPPIDAARVFANPVEITAPLLTYTPDERSGVVTATGGVRLQSGGMRLRADSLTFDRSSGRATLSGAVRGVDGNAVVSADAMTFEAEGRSVFLKGGTWRVVDGVDSKTLENTLDSGTRAPGRTRLTVRAERLSRPGGEVLEGEGVWLSSCACEQEVPCPPLVAVSAERARVVPGDVAELHGAWVRLLDVPLIPVPYLPLPLARRKTGFLFPRLSPSGPGGVTIEQPFFLTLGESMDLTFRPRFSFGNAGADAGATGVRGPGGEVEWRWTPDERTSGSMRLNLLFDTTARLVEWPRGSDVFVPDGMPRGLRALLSFDDVRPVLGGLLVSAGELASDRTLLQDLAGGSLERARVPYLPTRTHWSAANELGSLSIALGAYQRLGTALSLLDTSMPEPLSLPLVRAAATVGGALGNLSHDESLSTSLESTRWQQWSITPPRFRAHASGRQQFVLVKGPAGALVLEAGERGEAIAFTSGAIGDSAVAGFAGVAGRFSVSRAFGDWLHVLTPSVRVRASGASGRFGTVSNAFTWERSELDAATINGVALLGEAGVSTTLGSSDWNLLRLDVAWHPWLTRPSRIVAPDGVVTTSAGQLRAGLALDLGPRALAGTLHLATAWQLGLALPASAGARWSIASGALRLSTGLGWYAASMDDQLARTLDQLFTTTAMTAADTAAGRLQADATLDATLATGLTLRGSLITSRTLDSPAVAQQYALSAAWDVAGCARVSLSAAWSPNVAQVPQVGFAFELGDVSASVAAAAHSLSDR